MKPTLAIATVCAALLGAGCGLFRGSPPPEPAGAVAFELGGVAHTEEFVALQHEAHVAMATAVGEEPLSLSAFTQRLIDEMLLLDAAAHAHQPIDPVLLARIETQRREQIAAHFIEHVLGAEITVTDAEIAEHHRANLDQFTELAQVRMIQMRFEGRDEAAEAQRRAREGEDFSEVAEALGTREKDLGWFSRGQYDLHFEEVAFGLEVGEVSDVVSTDLGHLILLMVGSIPERVQPLEEVADAIRADLLAERRRERLRRFLERARQAEGIAGPPALVP